MNLGVRVAYFCAGVALSCGLGGGIALVIGGYFKAGETLAVIPYVLLFAVLLGSLSMLTSWVGFALAQRLRHQPTQRASLAIGCAFGLIPVAVVALADGNFLHTFAPFIVLGADHYRSTRSCIRR